MSKIEVNQISSQCGSTLTVGQSGDTVTLAAGATQTGFGRTGTVDWDTTAKTAGFTAVSGTGYFVNTTSGAITVTLPASPSAGNIVSVSDYNGTASTNAITIARNSSNINGAAADLIVNKENSAVTLVYVDATVGWTSVQTSNTLDTTNLFIAATGGTITCCGDYKIHTFTSPGTFCVSCAGNSGGSETVDYMVIAGGASGGNGGDNGAGGGAGGFRLSNSTCMPAPLTSPLATPTALPVSAIGYPITVGAGGAAVTGTPGPGGTLGNDGSNSIFSSITSAGGGGGGIRNAPAGAGRSGGSGGGGGNFNTTPLPGGAGNTPPVSPSQGNPGGFGQSDNATYSTTGGGGGAGSAGQDSSNPKSGDGGSGSYVVGSGFAGCNGTPGPVCGARYFAGGGGGGKHPARAVGVGGVGGGGVGGSDPGPDAGAGVANTGGAGGGGSSGTNPQNFGAAGGSGIVIIRYKFQ